MFFEGFCGISRERFYLSEIQSPIAQQSNKIKVCCFDQTVIKLIFSPDHTYKYSCEKNEPSDSRLRYKATAIKNLNTWLASSRYLPLLISVVCSAWYSEKLIVTAAEI